MFPLTHGLTCLNVLGPGVAGGEPVFVLFTSMSRITHMPGLYCDQPN